MHARKIAVSLFALALGVTFAGFAAASPDTPAAAPATSDNTPQVEAKACCKHHEAAAGATGAHCDHAKADGKACCAKHADMKKKEGEGAEACCTRHAAMHKEGAEGHASCAKHAEMMKDGAPADGKACCAEHTAMMKDGDKAGCCCGGGDACPHHAAQEAPAKS